MLAIVPLTLIVALLGSSSCTPVGTELFPGFYRNANLQAPSKEADINKRLALELNPDASLKQISLQGLIGNLEQSLFQSAISVSGVGQPDEQVLPEVRPTTSTEQPEVTEHAISKRSTVGSEQSTVGVSSTEVTSTTSVPNQVLLQTTKRVPESNGVPAHILIDRISVQPHTGQLPLIPTFQVQHTKVVSAANKEAAAEAESSSDESRADATKISITQTVIKATSVRTSQEQEASSSEQTTTAAQSGETTVTAASAEATTNVASSTTLASTEAPSSTSTFTSTSTSTSTSTAKPLVELKQAEEELKEKVAEIEAEPVILTARV